MRTNLAIFALLFVFVSRATGDPPQTQPAVYDRAADTHELTVFMEEGGWCWYQDPRAIVHDGMLLIGAVQGNASGPALVGLYDLKAKKRIGTVTMHDNFHRDDHNSPVFFARPDGSVLAMYALHGQSKVHYYRISNRDDLLKWGPEQTIDHAKTLPERDRVTYMNLINISSEGKLYNFYRGFQYNPSFVSSTDNGLSWGEDTHFIKSDLAGYQRPYARYVGNGLDTVHVSFTDAHPDRYGNHIYYAAFRDGKFFRADGTLIKTLRGDGPLRTSESERVFQGSGKTAPKGRASAENSAWTSSIALDAKGYPHIAYSLHRSNQDHRYRIASWDGTSWHDREVAFAGNCLYDDQTSYTGLISLDPKDPTVVVISTDVNPKTGEGDAGHHEIYRAQVGLHDNVKTIVWTALTNNSPVRNLRPMIVRDGNTRVILWNRGDFETYTNFQLDTVGMVETTNDGI